MSQPPVAPAGRGGPPLPYPPQQQPPPQHPPPFAPSSAAPQQQQQQVVTTPQHVHPPQPLVFPDPVMSQHAQPYQLTHAQLSPAIGAQDHANPTEQQATERPPIKKKLQQLFQRNSNPSSNVHVGFTPTQRMAVLHEKHAHQPVPARPLYQFQVTKLRSWRTGYVRLLALYETEFATLDPSLETLTETNRWPYSALTEWQAMDVDNILLQVGTDKLKFSCHYVDRAHVLTALLKCQGAAGLGGMGTVVSSVERYTRHGTRVPVQLIVKPYGLVEVEAQQTTTRVLQTYLYTSMSGLSLTAQHEQGLVLHFQQPHKSRLYWMEDRARLVRLMLEQCQVLGVSVPWRESQTAQQWLEQRRSIAVGPVATRWPVRKTTARHGTVSRQLALTGRQGYLVEHDGSSVVSCRQLADLSALVRLPAADEFLLEFANGTRRTYASSNRDALLVSILDAATTTLGQNVAVHITNIPSDGYCLASMSNIATEMTTSSSSLFQPISIPVYSLKRVYALATQTYAYVSGQLESLVQQQDEISIVRECRLLVEACREFNASVLPTGEGLPTGASDKTLSGCLGALWGLVVGLLPTEHEERSEQRVLCEETICTFLQTIYRLSRTLTGYRVSAELTTLQEAIPNLLTIQDAFAKYWALQVLDVLLSGFPKKRDLEAEYVNKNVLLKCGGSSLVHGIVSSLVETSEQHQRVSDLILMAASNVLQSILCSFHDTTSPEHFGAFIRALAERHWGLLSTLRSQSPCVIENTSLLLQLLSTHAPSTARAIRDEALSSAILLRHFYLATFSPMEGQRFLSRYLCSLWLSGPKDCPEKRLLKRMVPNGFLTFLGMPLLSRVEEEQLDELERDSLEENVPDLFSLASSDMLRGASGTNMMRLRSRISLATATASEPQTRPENFRIFFHVLTQNHNLPDLIWSQQTRRELRIALESEIAYVKRETEARGINGIAWNHQQFRVPYPSLDNEVKVGNVYMRLWLEAGDGFIKSWEEPLRLFEHLFRKFLCEIDRDEQVTNMVIRCLEKLYAVHAEKIGPFPDVMILVQTMSATKSIETQHLLLRLLATVLGVGKDNDIDSTADIPENAEQLLNMESIGQLCQFVAWAHTDRAQIGNILSQALSVGATKRAMITDGTNAGPASGSSPSAADDTVCPPVWFVASTSKIPPPPESVRGPFRVSDLVRMMDSGDLSPYDLVTTTHVEEYEVDLDSETVQETQIDTGKWKRLNQVWQLRWTLCTDNSGLSILAPVDVASLALRALTRLVDLHRSLDGRGVPYLPIPIAKRILTGSYPTAGSETDGSPLATLSQAILCSNAQLVDQAADIIYKVTRYNERATQKLYLTGVYFFACCYTGSNFKSLARLLDVTHLEQHFRSGFAAAADESELPMKERSILGQILPEGLLFILVNYGAERFAEIFVGSADTPEVIWTFEMRKHLIELIHQHLGDYPLRLFQNNSTEYEYCPMPGVAYKRLEKELFCHNYYLHNLCDEVRFPDWPIAEPVEVFRACLEQFKKQLEQDESCGEDALERARQVLELKEGDSSKELRKAYRKLARVYHPDKNPSGRDKFESIQVSYELLLPLLEGGEKIRVYSAVSDSPSEDDAGDSSKFSFGGSQMQTMQLLIRTQLLICRRYEKEMSRYKYPAYQVLLSCVELPAACAEMVQKGEFQQIQSTALVRIEVAEFVSAAVELIYRTCLVSPLNAEELVSENGVPLLANLLSFFSAALVGTQAPIPEEHASVNTLRGIITCIIRTLAGVAFYDNGREAIKSLDSLERYVLDLCCCMDGTLRSGSGVADEDMQMKRFAVECIGNMAKDPILQDLIIGSGAVWSLVRFILTYDPTHDKEAPPVESSDAFTVASTNDVALHSVRALGMLTGALEEAPTNEKLTEALRTLLTPPIATMLRNKRSSGILRVLNTNVESADIIWSAGMRKQLEGFVARVEKERPDRVVQSAEEELKVVTGFEYDALKHEARIGGVYIRIFNKLGRSALSRIPDATAFCIDIVNFIARYLNATYSGENWAKIPLQESAQAGKGAELSDDAFSLASRSLVVLCQADGVLESVLEQSSTIVPAVLLSLLELPLDSEAFDAGVEALSIMSPKQSFADAVAREAVLWRLLLILERPDITESSSESSSDASEGGQASKRKVLSWSVLEALSSSPTVASQIVQSSAWVELLGVCVGYSEFTKVWTARSGAAKTLSRLLWDPATAVVMVDCLSRFLPPTLIVKLKDDPEAMLEVFDADSDTPELIWDSTMRAELRKVIAKVLDEILDKRRQTDGQDLNFAISPTTRVRFAVLEKELYIGGVYVARFLKEPTFGLRDPTTFLEHLLQRWAKEFEKYTVSLDSPGAAPSSDAITEADQDVLSSVTTAIVFLCKVRDNLCDKFAEWGYIPRLLQFLGLALERDLVGTPLLSVVRLLHVAAGRMSNVEALALEGQGDSERGVVRLTMRSINADPLHEDCAFMIEFLKRLYEVGLGDVRSVKLPKATSNTNNVGPALVAVGPSPSPAPGEGPVRKRVDAWDDPLAMMQAAQAPTSQAPGNLNGAVAPQAAATQQNPPNSAVTGVHQLYQPQSSMATASKPNQSFQGHSQQSVPVSRSHHMSAAQQYTRPSQTANVRLGQQTSQQSYMQRSIASHETAQAASQQLSSGSAGTPYATTMSATPYTGGHTHPQFAPHQTQPLYPAHGQAQQGVAPNQRPVQSAGSYGVANQVAQNFVPGLQPGLQQQQQMRLPQQQQVRQSGPTPNRLFPQQRGTASDTTRASASPAAPLFQSPHQSSIAQTQSPAVQVPRSFAPTSHSPARPAQPYSQPAQQYAPSTQQQAQQYSQPAQQYAPSAQQYSQPAQQYASPMQQQAQQYSQPAQQYTSPMQQQAQQYSQPTQQYASQTQQQVQQYPQPAQQYAAAQNDPSRFTSGESISTMSQSSAQSIPVVETVPEPVPVQQYRPTAVEGAGIDARSAPDPQAKAEQHARSSAGAPGSAQGRVSLLKQALDCDLCEFLVNDVLENPGLQNVRDPAAAKVHTIALLKLLTKDPGYGPKFKLILSGLPAWAKYKSQDHSLLITSHEQKADYFLTDGGAGEKKLLTAD